MHVRFADTRLEVGRIDLPSRSEAVVDTKNLPGLRLLDIGTGTRVTDELAEFHGGARCGPDCGGYALAP